MADNNGSQRESLIDKALKRKTTDLSTPANLKKNPRIHENFIQFFLLACGLLSIITTIGILYVLLQESLIFFNRDLWENTNRPIVEAIDAEQTTFQTRAVGRQLEAGTKLRIGNEELFLDAYVSNSIDVEVTGTGGGFEIFCAGDSFINNASRMITSAETETCSSNDITPVEFQIGIDALTIVVNSENDFATDLTPAEIALIFSTAETWSDVRPEWVNEPITRFIPGEASGTFDYFVDAIFDGDSSQLPLDSDTFVTSEDDNQLVRGVSNNPYAVGFFGYGFFADNQNNLTAVAVDGVSPSVETAIDSSYPLARPLFIYVNQEALANEPHLAGFISYYLQNVSDVINEAGYFTAPSNAIEEDITSYLTITGNETLPDVDVTTLTGDIRMTGSSTVSPISKAIADNYIELGYLPTLTVTRGFNETIAEPHPANATIQVGDEVSLGEFFTGLQWQPAIRDFGILPLIYGTLATSFIAMLVALPLGMGAAIYLSEYAPENVRKTVKPILEILAGIPTVVYGYFALTFMTPFLQLIFDPVVQIYNSTSAGIVVGILIIPMVSSMSEDALSAVPRGLREASYGLGATKLETTVKVVIPAALSGIMAAFIIAVSRAVGETMIVALAAGAGPQNNIPRLLAERGPGILFEPAETMTGHIARISGGDLSYNSIDYNSIFAIGLVLFVITFVLNLINNAIIRRFREEY